MYHVSRFAAATPDRVAATFIPSGRTVTFGALDAQANQAANALQALGLKRGDCVGISVTNRPEFLSAMLGAQRIGLYYVLLSTKLSVDDLAYVVGDSKAKVVIVSRGCFAAETPEVLSCLGAKVCLLDIEAEGFDDWAQLVAVQPASLPAETSRGRDLLYSSGSTGRPKGILKALPDGAFDAPDPFNIGGAVAYGFGPSSVVLSPCPLYHAAPHRFANITLHAGGMLVLTEQFDPEMCLKAIEAYGVSHSLWVPTMFHRMLQLPDAVRSAYDLSTHRHAVHGAAPCPVHVKQRMIQWWGPIIDEYYSGSEGVGSTNISSAEWLAHPGSVGRPHDCAVHVLGPDGAELPVGEIGDIYFESAHVFEYLGDAQKTGQATSAEGWRTFGDIGYVDADGYLYLTDRRHFTIISGGVNLYPQEIESVLLEHEAIKDAAVIGVPDEEFGQVAMAVVELVDQALASDEMKTAIRSFVRARLGPIKTPKAVAFETDFPRHATGKLYKRELIARYS
ncbi:AMP-binding protein [Brevundimonas sp. NPDC090276]|uniref:AMP-binding protein n=1 Tax=Brevundimonas sp. NPDC090276 TaxID=3363956 RepID=UPI00383B0A66